MPALGIIALGRNDAASAIGRHQVTCDLRTIVDRDRFHQLQSRTWKNKRVQVNHGSVVPQERADRVGNAGKRLAYDLIERIDSERFTEAIAVHGAEINGHAMLPEVRMGDELIRKNGSAHNMSGVVNRVGSKGISSGTVCKQVDELFPVPQKWVEISRLIAW